MNRRNLFLVCPDCHIEKTILDKFCKNCFLLTALGSVFSIEGFEYAEEVNQATTNFDIEVVYLVNDCECRFIHNCVVG